ncbi:MAG: hypothetical protein IPQ07_05705 [Myxococcales bacterium]|nr:hypothetical protein [Myxococcales bacterium]
MPAVSRFGLIFTVIGGCWNANGPSTAPQPNNLEASAHDPTGNYWCSIDDPNHTEFRCEIKRTNGKLRLTKLNGAERIRGELRVEGDQLEFAGERFCLWEDCTAKLHGRFVPVGSGEYRGTFKEHPLVVRLAPMPAGAVGGQGYGGDAYGGVDIAAPIGP